MKKYYKVVLEGIDKTGKDLIKEYIRKLSKGKYTSTARGVMSLIAYADLYKRNYKYDLESEKNTLHVLLTVDKEDWEVRCALEKEPPINYTENILTFNKAKEFMLSNGIKVVSFNTSVTTPYKIALNIIEILNSLE